MLERTCSTTGIKSHQRRMRYSMKQVLGSLAGREIIIPSKETDLFWIREPSTVHLKIPVLSGCPQNTTINWLTHHGTTTEMQSCDDWGTRIERKIRKTTIRKSRTVLHHSNAYIHSKIPLFYNRRAAEDVGSFLGVFAKLQKATTVFVMSICLSNRPPGTRVPLDRFPQNLTTTCILHEDLYTFMTIFRWIIFRMRNVSHKNCRESQNTHFMLNNLFPRVVPFMR